MLWITIAKTASVWVTRRVRSLFPVYTQVRRKSECNTIVCSFILLSGTSGVVYISILIVWDDTLEWILSSGCREWNSYLVSLGGNAYTDSEWSLIILLFISPEVIRGFYWLGPRVDLPVLQTTSDMLGMIFQLRDSLSSMPFTISENGIRISPQIPSQLVCS